MKTAFNITNLDSTFDAEEVVYEIPWWVLILVEIFYVITCVVGLAGNILVTSVICQFSKMRTVENIFILNLAIADVCYLVGIPLIIPTSSLGYWPFGAFFCKVYFITAGINQISRPLHLLVMTVDRFLAVCFPNGRHRTALIANIISLFLWILSVVIIIPMWMYANTLEYDTQIDCKMFWPDTYNMNGELIYVLYIFVIGFTVPLELILILSILIIIGLRKETSEINSIDMTPTRTHEALDILQEEGCRTNGKFLQEKVATKLLLTIIVVHFLCMAPYWATRIAVAVMPDESNYRDGVLNFLPFVGCLTYLNSALNPILYAHLSESFQKSFRQSFECSV